MNRFSSKLAGQQSGFTLIELVIVIVIIGILAAVAIPNFADVSSDAKQSTVDGIAASLSAAAAANYAVCQSPTMVTAGKCKTVTSCATALSQLLPGTTVTSNTWTTPNTCTLVKDTKTSAAVIVLGAGS